jgi:hypothetical protein
MNRPRAVTSRSLGAAASQRAAFVVPMIVLGLVLASPSARAQSALRLDGLAAVVGGRAPGPGVDVILQSDVELRARIAWAGETRGALGMLELPSSVLAAALQEIIGEQLIAREARRVQAATPSAADIERERVRLLRAAGGEARMRALLAALGAGQDELDAIARRRALVGAFLSANLEGVTVVTEAEAERALEQDKAAFAGREREAALLELRGRLSREALDRTIARWVAVLGSRTPVRVYVSY